MERITLSAKNLTLEQRQAIGALFGRPLADDDRLMIRLTPAGISKKPRLPGPSPWRELKRMAEAQRREQAENSDKPESGS
jgi:hypothetical protein